MKRICIIGGANDGALKVGESSMIFQQVAQVLNKSLHIENRIIGEEDVILKGPQLNMLKTGLQSFIEDEIGRMQKDEKATRKVQFMDKTLELNVRNDQHRALASMIMIYKMADNQLKESQVFYVFNLTPLDNTDTYIVMTIKEYGQSETKNFFYTLFISKYEQFADMTYKTFADRVHKLSDTHFLSLDHSGNLVSVTEKTSKIPL